MGAEEAAKPWLSTASTRRDLLACERKLNNGVFNVQPELKLMRLKRMEKFCLLPTVY